jgi:HlyD family secretion protein
MVVKKSLFRQKALDQLSSPEELNQLVRVIGPKEWWWLGTLGLLVAGVALWSIFGRIPITVTGRGVLLSGEQDNLVGIKSSGSGNVVSIAVSVGDRVKAGQVVAEISQPELQLELNQEQQTLASLQQTLATTQRLLDKEGQVLERQRSQERQGYERQIAQETELSHRLREETLAGITNQLQTNQQQIQRLQTLARSIQANLEQLIDLRHQGLVLESVVLEKEQELLTTQAQIDSLENQGNQLALQRLEAEKNYQDTQAQIRDLRANITELQSQAVQTALDEEQTLTAQTQAVKQARDRVQALQRQLSEQGRIVSPYDGTVLSIEAQEAGLLEAGTALMLLDRSFGTDQLTGFAYFSIANGKQINPDMEVQITPDNVNRAEDGGILGQVSAVSSYPLSQEAVDSRVGSQDLGSALTLGSPAIEAEITLQKSATTPSGYAWSSGNGPDQSITHGTTASVLVAIDERAPITFVIPLLRKITGLD